MGDYILTIQFPFGARDDMAARAMTRGILDSIGGTEREGMKIKLKEIYKDRAPRNLSMKKDKE